MIFQNVSRGLFEKDKILYSFLITTSIKRNAKVIDEAMWNILLRGPTVFTNEEKAGILKNPDPVMLTTLNWETLVSAELRSGGQFLGLTQHIVDNWSEWKKWARTEMPYVEKVPGEFEERLSNFDRLVLIKAFRMELIQLSFAEYIIREQGKFYVESVDCSMGTIFP